MKREHKDFLLPLRVLSWLERMRGKLITLPWQQSQKLKSCCSVKIFSLNMLNMKALVLVSAFLSSSVTVAGDSKNESLQSPSALAEANRGIPKSIPTNQSKQSIRSLDSYSDKAYLDAELLKRYTREKNTAK